MEETTEQVTTEIPKKRNYHKSAKSRMRDAARREAKEAMAAQKDAERAAKRAKKLAEKTALKRKEVEIIENKIRGTSDSLVVTGDELWKSPVGRKMIMEEKTEELDYIFRPNSGPQEKFLAASEMQVLYGGQAGGGKSYGMLADPLRYSSNPNMRALLLRRNMPELLELIDKSRSLYPRVFPKARFKEKDHRWEFPSGATLQFNFVEDDKDVYRYQGQAFSWVGIDEITHYPTPFVWEYLTSRLRTTDPTIKLYMRCTANPGGVGGWWVKKMFIDPAPPGQAFWATNIEKDIVLTYPHIEAVPLELRGKPLFKRRFIPAKLTDNPYLMQSPEYLANLASLPEVQRKRLLEGDWDIAEDTAFPEFDKRIHVVQPFEIPDGWYRWRACDYGYVAGTAVLWFAMSYDGTIYVYRELYRKGLDAETLAETIHEMEADDPGILTGPLDTETWSARGQSGLTPADTMIKLGVRWNKAEKGPGSRVRGKSELHRKLRVNPETGKPGLMFFANCKNLIKTMPILPLDDVNVEDVDGDFPDDHLYDALRYGATTRTKYSLFPEERAFIERAERHQVFDEVFGA